MVDIQGLDFNLLKALQALLVTQSVSEAARRVGVTQPAMSAALSRLRVVFDDPLLIRRGNRMLPTPRAADLVETVSAALDGVRRVFARPDEEADVEPPSEVSIATTDDVVTVLGPGLVRSLSGSRRIVFKSLDAEYNRTGLELGGVDVVITVDWTAPGQLRRRHLFTDQFVTVAMRSHPLARGRVSAASFAAASHLLVAPLGGARGPVDAALAERDLQRQVSMVAPTFSVVPQLLRSCPELVCTLPGRVAQRVFSRRSVAWIRTPVELPALRYDLFWHRRTHADLRHRALRRRVLEAAQAVEAQTPRMR